MLQTHLNDEEHLKLQHCGFDEDYFPFSPPKAEGGNTHEEKKLSASLHGKDFALLNVYCPACHPLKFLMEAFAKLSDFVVESTIVGGDFNCPMNPLTKSFPLGVLPQSKQSKQIICLCKDFKFTFFS